VCSNLDLFFNSSQKSKMNRDAEHSTEADTTTNIPDAEPITIANPITGVAANLTTSEIDTWVPPVRSTILEKAVIQRLVDVRNGKPCEGNRDLIPSHLESFKQQFRTVGPKYQEYVIIVSVDNDEDLESARDITEFGWNFTIEVRCMWLNVSNGVLVFS
jgi:hypothetical protein